MAMAMAMTMMMMMMMMMGRRRRRRKRRRRRRISIGTEPRVTLCASLCSRNARQHFTRFTSLRKCTGKMSLPQNAAQTLCESHVIRKFTGKMPRPSRNACQDFTRGRNAYQDFKRATQFTGKRPHPRMSPERRHTLLCKPAVEMHSNISQEPLYTEIYRENASPQNRGADFVRACAVETHVKISQEPLLRKFTGKGARPEWAPWSSTGLCSYCKNPSLWAHCLGKNCPCWQQASSESAWSCS